MGTSVVAAANGENHPPVVVGKQPSNRGMAAKALGRLAIARILRDHCIEDPHCATQVTRPKTQKEAIEILCILKGLCEADLVVLSELADDALDDAAHLLWKSDILDDLITRASKLYRPPPT
jgi:hypothetical protein